MSRQFKPAVGYIRMSTDRQVNSPDRQRREINGLAEREGYRITKWDEDHGLTGTESATDPSSKRYYATLNAVGLKRSYYMNKVVSHVKTSLM